MLLLLIAVSLIVAYQGVSQQKALMSGLIDATQSGFDERPTVLRLLALASAVLTLGLVVTISGWIYIAYRNLEPLGATRMRYSPASAAFYAVFPVISLVTFWPVLSELWEGSDPWRPRRRDVFERPQSPWLIYVLLTLVLVEFPLGAYSIVVTQTEVSLDKAILLTNLGIACAIVGCLQAVVLYLIVNQITRNQSMRHDMLNGA